MIRRINLGQKEKGFTIIELLMAMTFFSFVLLLAVSSFLQINRSYTAGLTTKRLQTAARSVTEELGRAVRNASANSVEIRDDPAGPHHLCVGDVRYSWNMYNPGLSSFTQHQFSDVSRIYEMNLNRPVSCGAPVTSTSSTSIVDNDVTIQFVEVKRIGATSSFEIEVVVSTNARDAVFADDFSAFGQAAKCKVRSGDQYCDVAAIKTVVTARN